jgi:hypothetical protein
MNTRNQCSSCVVLQADLDKQKEGKEVADEALVQEKDAHAATKQLWESSKATIQQLVADKLVLEDNVKRNEAMAIEVVRHLYFSVKLDGSGNKDGSFIYWTFCV